MLLRREGAGDDGVIASVHAAAFARPEAPDTEPPEVELVAALRASDAWIPELSIVAIADDVIVGHVVCTRGTIDDVAVLGLGPLGVRPDVQRAGVGSALMHAIVAAADAMGERIIGLLGSVDYYPRFGFEPASAHGIEPPPDWYGDHFQVRTLSAATGDAQGRFRYAPAFDAVP